MMQSVKTLSFDIEREIYWKYQNILIGYIQDEHIESSKLIYNDKHKIKLLVLFFHQLSEWTADIQQHLSLQC